MNVHWHPENREERGEAFNHGRPGNIRKWEYKWQSREFINYVKEVPVLVSCGQRAFKVNVHSFERLRRFDEMSFLRAGELRFTLATDRADVCHLFKFLKRMWEIFGSDEMPQSCDAWMTE